MNMNMIEKRLISKVNKQIMLLSGFTEFWRKKTVIFPKLVVDFENFVESLNDPEMEDVE